MSNPTMMLILEKIKDKDKDFRYMATSDLLNELQKDTFKVDGELERKLCQVVLNQLEDSSGDISGLAVKCLGLLVRKVAEGRAEEMIRSLCSKVVSSGRDQQRDIASIGLKTVIQEIQGGALANVASALITKKMLEGIQQKESPDVVDESLDILTEVVSKFGNLMASEHAQITEHLLQHLDGNRTLTRKRAMHCIGAVSVYLSEDLLDGVVNHVISRLQAKNLKQDIARTYVQTVGQISRAVGYRFGKHLDAAVPLVMQYCEAAGENDDELREYSLQALESFVVKSSERAREHLDTLLSVALRYLRYDPNWADGDAEEQDEEEEEEEEEEEGDSDDEFSDDEDMSWKVRRAAARLLSAIIANFPEQLTDIYSKAASKVVSRFRDREESVKMDVFHAYIDLLRQVSAVSRRAGTSLDSSPLALLRADVAGVSRAATRELKSRSVKTRVGVLALLRELVAVTPDSLAPHVAALIPGVLHALNQGQGSSSALKIEALSFLRALLESNSLDVFAPHVAPLAPAVFKAADERYYKVAAEALRVCEQLVRVLQPQGSTAEGVTLQLLAVVSRRLGASDQDQEVKEAAIGAAATLLVQLGSTLPQEEVQNVLKMLLERLRNEIMRLTAVKAFTALAAAPDRVDLAPVLAPVLAELTSFLRKANRPLRYASLQALEVLVDKHCSALESSALWSALEESAALVSDADLALAALSLNLVSAVLAQRPESADLVAEKVIPAALVLVQSPLLQGAALDALQRLFAAAASSGAAAASFEALRAGLLKAGAAGAAAGARQAHSSTALCIAVLCAGAEKDKVSDTVSQLLATLQSGSADVASRRLALLCLGEIGRRTDLSPYPAVDAAVSAALSSESEEMKGAASLALGGISCGNLPRYLPALLAQIQAAAPSPKQQYLLLQSLNEVITTLTGRHAGSLSVSDADVSGVLALLLALAGAGEEECRAVVAECAGRLALLRPEAVLPALVERASAPEPAVRGTVAAAAKYMMVDRPHPVDAALMGGALLRFLSLMEDGDHHVRRAAVVALTAAAHHKHALVAPHLAQLMHALYAQTEVRAEMVRTVDLGPFKHQIDDGLDLRKAAFECLDILQDVAPASLAPAEFLLRLQSGLRDHYDVKMPCHLMLTRLAEASPAAVLSALDLLVEPLEKTLNARTKSDAVKQELDRHEDMLRSCLRCIDALSRLPGVESCTAFTQFMRRSVLNGPHRERFAAVQAERAAAGAPLDSMDTS